MARGSTEQPSGALDEDLGPRGDSIEDDEDLGEPTDWDPNTPDEHADAGLGDKAAGGSSTGEEDTAPAEEEPSEETPFDPDKTEWDKLSQEEAAPLIAKMTPEQLRPFLLRTSKFTEGMTENAREREGLERREAAVLAREEVLARGASAEQPTPGTPTAPGATATGPTPQVIDPQVLAQGRQMFQQLEAQLGRRPEEWEFSAALAQGLIQQAVQPLTDYHIAENQEKTAVEFNQQWAAVQEKYGMEEDQTLRDQIIPGAMAILEQRPLQAGDVERLYLSLGGEDSLQALIEKRAQELLEEKGKGKAPQAPPPSPPPGGTQSGKAPPTSDLDEIAKRQRKRFA